MTENNQDNNCPICYELMNGIKDISTTVCNHQFHTRCIIRCNGLCPICRTNLITNKAINTSIPPGRYNISEYMELMQKHNVSIDDVPIEMREAINHHNKYKEELKLLQKRLKESEEKEKETLKKEDPKKYKLFYGK